MNSVIHIVGAGLAGSEAAFMAASMGAKVILHEMRPETGTEAHQTGNFAELVCSNSLRSDDAENNAVGLLHEEMRRTGSLILKMADAHRLPAGGALAVDREGFSAAITEAVTNHPNIEVRYERVDGLPPEDWGSTIIATGPLTHETLAEEIRKVTGEDSLHFFDAIAPIVVKDTVNMDVVFAQSRYDKGDGSDYLNCPFTEEQYNTFLDAMLAADKVEFHEWEKNTPYFEGCLPAEVMATRGRDTLRFGPMKPVGLTDPRTGARPYAVLQLRQDNALGTLWNLVGFQTKMKYGAQKEVFQLIPGLENAEFARFGGLHRNTFINSPRVLDKQLRLKGRTDIRFAGQVTGVEGYVESAAIGMLAGLMAGAEATGREVTAPPATTALGALYAHITGGANEETFQPMNVTFGLFPDLPKPEKGKPPRGREKKKLVSARALADIQGWIDALPGKAD